jgi:uncharacterized membrane protein|tara:strand:- start:23921 stop:24196 length:276 start_codon:yes stop_codon:yes gene_type:complete
MLIWLLCGLCAIVLTMVMDLRTTNLSVKDFKRYWDVKNITIGEIVFTVIWLCMGMVSLLIVILLILDEVGILQNEKITKLMNYRPFNKEDK